jgi:hypothetical protein
MTEGRALRRIGVTGHRALPDDPAFVAAVERVVIGLLDGKRADVVIVSALAEGADRLVPEIILAHADAGLEAVLPMEPARFEGDFPTAVSRAAFRALLARAGEIRVVPPRPTRNESYEAAGLAMLARIDCLIAVWDGQPARGRGGTAEIVAHARARGLPVLWLSTEPPYQARMLQPLATDGVLP